MDKWKVLMVLVVYYMVMLVTSFVFMSASEIVAGEFLEFQGYAETDSGWSAIQIIFGIFWGTSIPMLPAVLKAFIAVPFWVLLGYFIYLNIPKVAGSGSPNP